MASQKFYGASLSKCIKTAVQYDINPEDVTIISDTRFSNIEEMAAKYGPNEHGRGVWTQEQLDYATRVWEAGNIIQPREYMHLVGTYSNVDGASYFNATNCEAGPAIKGSVEDRSVQLFINHDSAHQGALFSDLRTMLQYPTDISMVSILQEEGKLPYFKNAEGEIVETREHVENRTKELIEFTELLNDGSKYVYCVPEGQGEKTITVPHGITSVYTEGVDVVILPETVIDVSGYAGIGFVCKTDEQKEIINRFEEDSSVKTIREFAENYPAEVVSEYIKYPTLSVVDVDNALAKFVDEHAVCYEEDCGVAKITFENGNGIYIDKNSIMAFDENFNIVAESWINDLTSGDEKIESLLAAFETVEKDGAKEYADMLDRSYDFSHNNDDIGISLDD